MDNDEVMTLTRHNETSVMKLSCNLVERKTGITAAKILTNIIFRYTLKRYALLESPIIPLSIYSLAPKQHWDIIMDTTSTLSG